MFHRNAGATAVLLGIALIGCAPRTSAVAETSGAAEPATVTVENDSEYTARIYHGRVRTERGRGTYLGTVRPRARSTFTLPRPGAAPITVRFDKESSHRDPHRHTELSADPGQAVVLRICPNLVMTVREAGASDG